MVKAHTPINWENEPSYNTPLNAANLNKMDSEIGILDDRIIEQDTIKLDKATANTMVKAISFNENTGVFTITLLNGSTTTIDTKLEKLVVNFGYDANTQQIILNLVDGTTQYIDLSALITQYEFLDSNTIGWEVTTDGKVKAKILDGSITENMLQPNYLAEIKVETEKSAQSMANAKISENNAKQSELNAKASEEQALEYSNNAQPVAQSVTGNNPTATNSTDSKVIYLKNSGYIKQDGTPTSGAPIHVDGLGDKGYFDGKLLQGYYTVADGSFKSDTKGVCCKNKIPCKNGDVINVTYEKNMPEIIVLFYDANDNYLSNVKTTNSLTVSANAPNDTAYFYFDIYDSNVGVTPSTAKHISVTINGNYAVRVKTCGKNLWKNVVEGRTVSGVTLSSSDEIFTLNGTATADGEFDYWFPFKLEEGYKLSAYLLGGSISDKSKVQIRFIRTSDWHYNGTTPDAEITTEDLSSNLLRIIARSGVVCTNAKIGVMVRKDGDNSYEPYAETQALIPISAPLYDGDYIEVFADGSGQIVRTKGVVDYSHAWYKDSTAIANANRYSFGAKVINQSVAHSTHFPCYPTRSMYNASITSDAFSTNENKISVATFNSNLSTIDAWKQWLQDNDVKFVYKLKTPTTESLTAGQIKEFVKLQTFKGVTHITADGEVTVRYYCHNDSGETVARVSKKANDSVSKSSIANNLTTTTEGMVLDATQGKALNDKISTLNYSLENRLSKSLVSKETINIDSLSLSSGGHSTITSEEISKSGYTLVGANFFLRGSYAENIIASFTIGGSSTKIYNFAFYNPSDYNISAYGYVDLIYVANSL